jgi:hypothetical protein
MCGLLTVTIDFSVFFVNSTVTGKQICIVFGNQECIKNGK